MNVVVDVDVAMDVDGVVDEKKKRHAFGSVRQRRARLLRLVDLTKLFQYDSVEVSSGKNEKFNRDIQ